MSPDLPLYIDSSMLVQFRSCPKKFWWEYCNSLRARGRKIDLVAGGAFAGALEAAYLEYFSGTHSAPRAYRAAYRAFADLWGDMPDPVSDRSAKTFNRTFAAVLDYLDVYPFETDHVRPLLRTDGRPSFEFSFSVPLDDPRFPRHPSGDPFLYCGRFDAFGHTAGSLVIRDEKTSGKAPDERWSEQWDMRNQFILYTWAARQSGYPVTAVVVRGITILKTKFHHVEAIKVYSDIHIEKALGQLSRDLHRLVDCWQSGYFDYSFGDSCNAFGHPCAYMPLCTADTAPETWFGEYDRERWNPLTRTTTPLEEPRP